MSKFYDDPSVMEKMGLKFQTFKTLKTENKTEIGYEALLFVQDLKMFHNENNIPLLIDRFIEKHGIQHDLLNDHRKNLVFYRR